MHPLLLRLRNNRLLLGAGLLAFALLLNREGTRVPGGNEQIYFLYLFKAWHPGFLAHDWTVAGEPTAGHAMFNFCFGWPTLFMPLWVYAWIGRFGSWCLLLAALLRLGGHFRIPPWMAATGIFLWLVQRQSFVANEWIIGTFEAKCIAYICLLWGIDLILRGNLVLPAVLIGLSFSFHSAVGLWGGLAVGIAFLLQNPLRRTIAFAGIAALFAVPGLLSSYSLIAGGHPITPQQARFVVVSEMPFHLDPLRFGWGKIVVLYLMLLFNVLQRQSDPNDSKLKFLVHFELSLGAIFLMGIFARLGGQFSLVQLFPFRVFAVMIMLLFFWHLAAAWRHRSQSHINGLAVALAILVLVSLPSFLMRLTTLAAYDLPRWRAGNDDFRTAAAWVRDHTPPNQIVIAPPWRKDAFYFTHHPLIACWHAPRYNDMTGWRERIESLAGDVSQLDMEQNLMGDMDDGAQAYYDSLSPQQIARIVRRYGGSLLITTNAAYAYPVLFATPTFRVYRLPMH